MAWITATLLVGNALVAFSDPVLFVGLILLACVRGEANDDNPADEDIAAREASERNTASANFRVRENDRETLLERLRHEDSRKAMLAAASNVASGGADNCLRILYQPSQTAALELVALTVTDDATGDGKVFNLPISTGQVDSTEHLRTSEVAVYDPAEEGGDSCAGFLCAADTTRQ